MAALKVLSTVALMDDLTVVRMAGLMAVSTDESMAA
jgi:hypothetical protein